MLRPLVLLVVIGAVLVRAAIPIIAYQAPNTLVGNQVYSGSIGMDFMVHAKIEVVALGVFDSGASGWNHTDGPLFVQIFNTDTGVALSDIAEFSYAEPGVLATGAASAIRVQTVEAFYLYPGFNGTIVAWGFAGGKTDYNCADQCVQVGQPNSGGGAISFVGLSRYGTPGGIFPTNVDTGPAVRYAAGSFAFYQG
jgi:hypothetical protein